MDYLTTRVLRVLGAAVTALVLISCAGSPGSDDASPATSPSSAANIHNIHDVMFAQHMIPHHQQAVDMSAMVPSHTNNSTLKVVAIHIKTDQQAEINILTDYLNQWDEALAGPGHMHMEGMVSHDTMNQLDSLHGAAFDTLWITAMIGHHQGAITMAEEELAHGQNPDALEMARIIITSQKREISYMTNLISTPE